MDQISKNENEEANSEICTPRTIDYNISYEELIEEDLEEREAKEKYDA